MALPYGTNHQKMMQAFINAGYPPHVAAGFTGNSMMESGVHINPAALNKKEGAIGAFQHRLTRRQQLEALAEKRGFDLQTLDAQLPFAIHELNTTYASAAERIKQAQSPEEAAALVDKLYEQSAGKHTAQRQEYARHVYNQFMGGNQPAPSPTQGAPVSAPVGGPGATMAGNSPAIQSILDQIAAEAGDNDMMGMASQDVAPAGATDLMAEQPEEPGLSTTQRVGLGIGALGEALSAWSGKRPMDLDFIHEIPMAAQKRKQQVNEREAMIQLLNEEGFTDIAEAGVNGLSLDDMRKAYEARLAANKPSSRMRQLQDAQRLVEQGRIEEAELLLADLQPDAPDVPTAIQEAQWLADPTVPQEQKDAYARSKLTPDRTEYLRSLGAETPEEMIALELQLRREGAATSTTNIDLGERGEIDYIWKQYIPNLDEQAKGANDIGLRAKALENLLDTGNLTTGKVQQALMPIKGWLDSIGISMEGLSEQEAFTMLIKGAIGPLTEGLTPVSDIDVQFALEGFASLGSTEEANRASVQFIQRLSKRQQDRAEFYRRFASREKRLPTIEEYTEHVEEKFGSADDVFLKVDPSDTEQLKHANKYLRKGDMYFMVGPDGSLMLNRWNK